MFDKVFPFLHLGGLLAALGYALVSLLRGDVPRFGLVVLLLAIYYIFLLHPAVKKEIARRKLLKK
ncbi:MAG TPA: hypothetical protein PLP83_03475 [Candidatus Aminicenantes bacterium]|nr:hypothetical protein [Candidatus Aminicenantes bacterium]